MLNALLASKGKMGQTFVEDTRVPVTWLKVGPCVVTQIKKAERDGYWAIQIGYGVKKIKNVTKPLQGHMRGVIRENKAPRFLREIKVDASPDFKVGDVITLSDIFKKGDEVAVTGISKGKGFAGVVKRWKFAGGPRTHGQSDRLRAPGSIGQGTTPGRVYKGKKMAGRMGGERVTVKNLIVVDVDSQNGQVAVSGPVPGIPNGLLIIKKLASGKLEELIEEAPQIEIQQGEEPEAGESGGKPAEQVEAKNADYEEKEQR
ncbi:50S ribosomal protein L3 [Candidatus Woesebacteria bacterium RIFCSPLOWO2_01_FULL_39_61]|uniref:Large ribosomal subunit protein uL3 n=2 Tax=Microgenomates group TaxID=1794810 RepID=A0A0H4T5H5_9BACT|nr:50S ribosomal protein L3, large subunit ribosomal protein L3 [uncultured Microgenomates bacterium Rifle_16ft_4_minimus_37836]OGM28088.1 MAG: 50S ribosomal protein L3 [Candidatus Woesebacteria bacterium RIFCSPHIGHO2_01_FULL_39_95]OGM34076.1 MAG: 50S ribosomal protein L3 [Candidatus Woesebacteria bacterium RIFCSPHIGHO2_02_FULL_39_13]OGM38335.1 MAG: 50S ribosomal protein L3 [Candidatus Woesebacteria bacterium RIFCSPHIGHO2_12_FULL_40_20]OGM67798.1 MAG: 50S ribosomal protein L3 [Candidatus Woeseb